MIIQELKDLLKQLSPVVLKNHKSSVLSSILFKNGYAQAFNNIFGVSLKTNVEGNFGIKYSTLLTFINSCDKKAEFTIEELDNEVKLTCGYSSIVLKTISEENYIPLEDCLEHTYTINTAPELIEALKKASHSMSNTEGNFVAGNTWCLGVTVKFFKHKVAFFSSDNVTLAFAYANYITPQDLVGKSFQLHPHFVSLIIKEKPNAITELCLSDNSSYYKTKDKLCWSKNLDNPSPEMFEAQIKQCNEQDKTTYKITENLTNLFETCAKFHKKKTTDITVCLADNILSLTNEYSKYKNSIQMLGEEFTFKMLLHYFVRVLPYSTKFSVTDNTIILKGKDFNYYISKVE